MRGDLGSGEPLDRVDVSLDGDMQAHIGRKLQKVYEEVIHEVTPARFRQLLEKLELGATRR